MSDAKITTRLQVVDTADTQSWLDFQDYFVKAQCKPTVQAIAYHQAQRAPLNVRLEKMLQAEVFDAVFIAPSNPLLSIAPILAIEKIYQYLVRAKRNIPVVAVSPLIAGQAVKGPTTKLMEELNMQADAVGIAKYYNHVINAMLIDNLDAHSVDKICSAGLAAHHCNTLMTDKQSRIVLANTCCNFAQQLKNSILNFKKENHEL